MPVRVLTWAPRRVPVATAFTVLLLTGSLLLHAVPGDIRTAVLGYASTSLANLADHPVVATVLSAFLPAAGSALWLTFGLLALAAAERALGSMAVAALLAVAHVLGTAISQGLLAVRIGIGDAALADWHLLDTGPSYVVVCAMAATVVAGRLPARLLCVGGFALVGPHLFDGLGSYEVSAIGHTCAIVIGVAGGWPLRRWSVLAMAARLAARRPVRSPLDASSGGCHDQEPAPAARREVQIVGAAPGRR
jgi:hypothetical protein